MKRLTLAASVSLVVLLPGLAQAKPPSREHAREYSGLYTKARHQFGSRAPGRNIMRDGYNNHRGATDADVVASIGVLQRMLAPPPPTPQASAPSSAPASYSSSGGLSDVPGVPASFAACVALRESSNGQASSNVYGIIAKDPGSSLAQQKATFSQMYQQMGTAPWAPYDGC